MLFAYTEASQQALEGLRDLSMLKWYAVPLLLVVAYIYSKGDQGIAGERELGSHPGGAGPPRLRFLQRDLERLGLPPLGAVGGMDHSR